jgi:DNA polymerase III delta prime subunit
MNLIFQNLDKNNLHHAYLIEGDRDVVLPEIFAFIEELGVKTNNNGDFSHIMSDSFRVDDARALKAFSGEKSNSGGKRIFVISANNFLLEAQNTLLKMFEEPIENTHFFVSVPDKNIMLPTLASRFYLLSSKVSSDDEVRKVEVFLKMNLPMRLEFIKEMLAETDEEADDDVITQNSARARALSFLNALETTLHRNLLKIPDSVFEHIMKVRNFLRVPGASAKSLMESVAILVPNL